ncbi:MAG: thioredoxin family protein [Rhizomicrobium sp.]|jgi:thiol:disulfide interchange protein
MRLVPCFLAIAALAASAIPSQAVPAPKVTSLSMLEELPTPLPYPYDEHADANSVVNAALAKARAEHKRAFIDLGGNWCGDCRVLAALMDEPDFQAFLDAHYVVVTVDVGRFNRNLQIPGRWNATDEMKAGGVPAILIVDPATNKLVDAGHTAALEDTRHMGPQGIMDWFAQWAK